MQGGILTQCRLRIKGRIFDSLDNSQQRGPYFLRPRFRTAGELTWSRSPQRAECGWSGPSCRHRSRRRFRTRDGWVSGPNRRIPSATYPPGGWRSPGTSGIPGGSWFRVGESGCATWNKGGWLQASVPDCPQENVFCPRERWNQTKNFRSEMLIFADFISNV